VGCQIDLAITPAQGNVRVMPLIVSKPGTQITQVYGFGKPFEGVASTDAFSIGAKLPMFTKLYQ